MPMSPALHIYLRLLASEGATDALPIMRPREPRRRVVLRRVRLRFSDHVSQLFSRVESRRKVLRLVRRAAGRWPAGADTDTGVNACAPGVLRCRPISGTALPRRRWKEASLPRARQSPG